MQQSNGVLHQVSKFPTSFETPKAGSYKAFSPSRIIQSPTHDLRSRSGRRSSSSSSVTEVPDIATGQGLSSKRSFLPGGENTKPRPPRSSRLNNIAVYQSSTPITPSLGTINTNNGPDSCLHRYQHKPGYQQFSQLTSTSEAVSENTSQTLSPRPERSHNVSFITDGGLLRAQDLEPLEIPITTQMNSPAIAAGNVPPSDRSGQLGGGLVDPSFRPRPAILDTTAAQDMSLPSPSLSPVTAAANLQNRRGYFEDLVSTTQNRNIVFHSSPPDSQARALDISPEVDSGIWAEQSAKAVSQLPNKAEESQPKLATPTLMEIPTILNSFEAMPSEMKSYVMYQLLRRCPTPVLHFVADVVNPALKCDFLSLLPVELSQNVIGSLDAKSLCQAAQVSRKWRQVIDSDEKTWKKLLDADRFSIPPGELQQAVLEGWGWQHSVGVDDFERDIGQTDVNKNDSQFPPLCAGLVDTSPGTDTRPQATQSRRSKRKAAPKSKPTSRKQQKRKVSNPNTVAKFDCEAMMRHVSAADGPYAAANAAAIAVPSPKIGLSSLQNLHLYKSLYRRHYLIHKSWMQDELKPRHLAFKAHGRHVVTCLQFDNDKILTGSDDTNINVYDTRTGALRARLEGHEGGVWALQYEGNVLVSGSTDRSVRVWDIEKGICMQVFQGHTSTVRCLQILMPTVIGTTSDGKTISMPKQPLIITGSRDSNLRVWKLPKPGDPSCMQTGQPQDDTECPYFVRALTGHHHSVRAIAAHADTLVSGSYDCTVRVWKISTGETVHRLQGHSQKVYSVVLDHQRNRCISGSMDNLVKVWSLDTGSVLYNLEGHSSLVGLLDLQQNRLVSAAADSTLRIWDPDSGHCKSILRAHASAITCFQHDGEKVVSGSDRTLKMWNVNTGEFVKDLLVDLSQVWQVKFDGRRCVAAVQRNNYTYIEVSRGMCFNL